MAKMFPDRLRDDVKSHAERFLYRAFQEKLSGNFTVFHQVRWQVRDLRSGARDGEADFVIACPNLGILVLEVKGGNIQYKGDNWYSNEHSIKDPFKQACDSKYNLLSRLKELHYWKNRWLPIDYAVAFPDVEVNGWLPLHIHHEIILDGTQLSNLSSWIQSVLNYWRGQNPPKSNFDDRGVKELAKVLSPSITPRSVLVSQIGAEERRIAELTEQQIGILDFLASHRRVAISGCAGSGKTLIALDKARRLHEQGFSVLLTCYNRGLVQFLRKSLGWKQNLHVYTFHGLCEKLFRQAGLAPGNNIPQDKLFNEIYPNLLLEAADKLNWRVDAVIVDEGQDFPENWWLALKLLLNDPDNGIFYFFHDNNQNIFGHGWQPPLEESPFALTKNCRNTQKIHSYVLQYYRGQDSTTALSPVGRDVEIHNYTNITQLKNTLGLLLHRLVIDGKVATKDIVILTTRRMQSLQNQVVGQFRIKAEPSINNNEIICNTIHHFKGLESSVVILVETEINNINHLRKLMYVGASRARNHLIVLRPDVLF